jgi:hypothetical protein
LGSGRTFEVRLVEEGEYWKEVNPFKKYVKRRSGRVGQRFKGSIVETATQIPVYSGDIQLAAWADTEKGKTVKFWIDEEATQHPFAGYTKRSGTSPGALFMMLLVLIGDDERPIDEETEAAIVRGASRRKLSQSVYNMINSPLFIRFMREQSRATADLEAQGIYWDTVVKGETMVKRYIKRVLKIESLSSFDQDPEVQRKFEQVFAKKFRRWNGGGNEG